MRIARVQDLYVTEKFSEYRVWNGERNSEGSDYETDGS